VSAPLNEGNFFDNVGGGSGAPSAKLKDLNDGVIGEIVDQFMTEATEFATGEVKRDKKTNEVIMQLVVILQTDLRNWQGVARVPLKDKDDKQSGPKDPSEDDGKRAVYIEPWTNIHAAVGKAIVEGTGEKGPLRNGGRFGVKVIDLKDTGKGNPLKVHQALYQPPAASGGDFFGEAKTAGGSGDASVQSQPAQQVQQQAPQSAPAQQAPAQGDPWATQPAQAAPAAQQAPAAQSQDPWGAPPASPQGPPF
jgi:hypothetical protein